MSQPTVAVLDTATGRRREAWVYAAGEMVAARQAAEAMLGARSAKAFAASPEGRYEVTGADGSPLGRFDLVDEAPVAPVPVPASAPFAAASPAPAARAPMPATEKQIAHIRRLCALPSGRRSPFARQALERLHTFDRVRASQTIARLEDTSCR